MAKEKILVVDDDAQIRVGCAESLRMDGYDVEVAEDGEKALEMLKKIDYNLVVTDLQMGEVGGLDVLKNVKENYPDCDVIIITAYPSVDSAVEALRVGVFDYIRKPIDLSELSKKVKQCLDQQKEKTEEKPINDILTTYEVSKLCNVTLATVVNWIGQGMIPAYKTPGGHRRIKREDLIEFLKKYKMPIPEELK